MNPLLILGASTRAAAFSAIRAGFDPICGDMFADADLRTHAAQMLDVPDYPRHLADAVRDLPEAVPWIYTGALENSPVEVDRLCERLQLWGNAGSVLRCCRDPWLCVTALNRAGLPCLELRAQEAPPTRDGAWLLKPLKSAAGRGIVQWDEQAQSSTEPHYFQCRREGLSISGAFLAGDGWVELLGISQQLIGTAELSAPAFGYCGSVYSPVASLNWPRRTQIQSVGEVLAREFELRGLFGIDFVDDGQTAWLTEINPRYTASMELLEYAYQQPLLQWHRAAFTRAGTRLDNCAEEPKSSLVSAKVILYADRHVRAPDLRELIPQRVTLEDLPEVADIPVPHSEIWPGLPVLTCLGIGQNATELQRALIDRALKLWAQFPGMPSK